MEWIRIKFLKDYSGFTNSPMRRMFKAGYVYKVTPNQAAMFVHKYKMAEFIKEPESKMAASYSNKMESVPNNKGVI